MQQKSAQLYELGPEAAARELDRHCRYCGALLIPRFEAFEVLGRQRPVMIWPDTHGCKAEMKALKARAIQDAEAEILHAHEQYQRRLACAGLTGWLANATFDSFNPRDNWAEAAELRRRVEEYATVLLSRQAANTNWLIMYGNYGTGKTHLAAAVIRMALDCGWNRVYFRVWTDYLKRLQASWKRRPDDDRDSETEEDIIAELQSGELVVIDDLDKRQPSTWTRSTLFSVINYRYNAQLPTILTFNYGPDDADPKAPGRLALEDYLGRAVLDRLVGCAYDVIEFTGPSFRSGTAWGVRA